MRTIDVTQSFIERVTDGGTAEQICRTCQWGPSKSAIGCEVTDVSTTKVLHADRSFTDPDEGITQIIRSDDGSVPVQITRNPRLRRVAVIESCGQQILAKCFNCAHFNAVTVPIETWQGWKIDQVIGGSCRRTDRCVRQQRDADPQGRKQSCSTCAFAEVVGENRMIEPLTPLDSDLSRYEFWRAQHLASADEPVPVIIGAMRQAKAKRPYPAMSKTAIAARKAAGKRIVYSDAYYGNLITFVARIAADHGDGTLDIVAPGSGQTSTVRLDELDERNGLVKRLNDTQVIITFLTPHHRDLGFPDRNAVRRTVFPTKPCPACKGAGLVLRCVPDPETGKVKDFYLGCEACGGINDVRWSRDSGSYFDVVEGMGTVPDLIGDGMPKPSDLSKRIHPSCSVCTDRPCYFHSKKPQRKLVTNLLVLKDGTKVTEAYEEVTFADPSMGRTSTIEPVPDEKGNLITGRKRWIRPEPQESPERTLILDDDGNVVDGKGSVPDPVMFHLRLRSILSWRTADRDKVWAQYSAAMSQLGSAMVKVNLAWCKFSTQPAYANVCSLHEYDRTHGGHPEGTGDGLLMRGVDLGESWNDKFGTPRSDMSTNPVLTGGYVEMLEGTRIWGLRRDPQFSFSRWQALEEWFRVFTPGAELGTEQLLNDTLVEIKRREPGVYQPKDFQLQWHQHYSPGVPGKNIIEPTVIPELPDDPAITPEYRAWLARKPTTAALAEYLDQTVEVPGNDSTETPAFWTNIKYLLGVGSRRGLRDLSVRDIPSTERYSMNPHSDPTSETQEEHEIVVCSECYDGSGDVGQMRPDEVTEDLRCPAPGCNGTLVVISRGAEWLAASVRMSNDALRELNPHHRAGGPTMAMAPDTASWNTSMRLQNTVCPHWRPSQRR